LKLENNKTHKRGAGPRSWILSLIA